MDKPMYEHDCFSCQFLGSFHKYDLYYCSGSECFVARESSEPSDNIAVTLVTYRAVGEDEVQLVIREACARAYRLNLV